MELREQQRLNVFIHRMAQSLIVHDDFIILPQNPENEQEKVVSEDLIRPLVLFRRRWNTLQIIRLMPADGLGSTHIERTMQEESHFLRHAKKSNAVRNMYALTIFIFSSGALMQTSVPLGKQDFITATPRALARLPSLWIWLEA